jgi:hypothetical protein
MWEKTQVSSWLDEVVVFFFGTEAGTQSHPHQPFFVKVFSR